MPVNELAELRPPARDATLFLDSILCGARMIKRLLLAAVLAAASGQAIARQPTQPSGSERCLAPDMRRADRISWFYGFSPADDLLTAWCRLQAIPGKVRFNVLFTATGMHRTWETSFDGSVLPATRIVEIIQSLLPVADGPAVDENGMEFHKVLRNVTQLAAPETPGGTKLAFPPSHPASRELILAEPVALRVRPVMLAGQEFTMTVLLRPNLGLLALGLQGKATDVVLHGWKGRMNVGSLFGGKCSNQVPLCEGLPEVVRFHAPWVVHRVTLEANGENLTSAAVAIISQLTASHAGFLGGTQPIRSFNQKNGSGRFTITDGLSVLLFEAKGGPGGTKRIVLTWEERKEKGTVQDFLANAFTDYINSTAVKAKEEPKPADSLGRL